MSNDHDGAAKPENQTDNKSAKQPAAEAGSGEPGAVKETAFYAALSGDAVPEEDNDGDHDHDEDGDEDSGEAPRPRAREHDDADVANEFGADGEERLQKILARAGFGSRRKCEELILAGRVAVNGTVQNQLGSKARITGDVITVDGEKVRQPKPVYYVVCKPKGWYCTDDVPDKKILDLIPGEHPRLFTVGRLDKACEGLMLATNDGRVANMLTHPRFQVPKVYKIMVKGHIKFEDVASIERALFYSMNGGMFERIKVLKRTPKSSGLRLIVYEGLPPSFRDICIKFGYPLSRITRVKVGPLELGGLTPGQTRKLDPHEVKDLLSYCEDIDRGRIKVNSHRMVTAQSLKKAAERGPEFESKQKGNRAASSAAPAGQKKMKVRLAGSAVGRPRRAGGGGPTTR